MGHTKFAPDWCFGLVKRLFRRTKVSKLEDIALVVDNSALCNFSQLVSTAEGTIIVPTMNWSNFFASNSKRLTGIKHYHHFEFSSSRPGIVTVKEQSASESLSIPLLKHDWSPSVSELPDVIAPKTFSAERQWYLHDMIRPFCTEESRDITCPVPRVPKVVGRNGTPEPSVVSSAATPFELEVPSSKK